MKLKDIKPGQTVTTDTGFTCMGPGPKLVKETPQGDLYVECNDGHHLLDGQIGENGHLIGIS